MQNRVQAIMDGLHSTLPAPEGEDEGLNRQLEAEGPRLALAYLEAKPRALGTGRLTLAEVQVLEGIFARWSTEGYVARLAAKMMLTEIIGRRRLLERRTRRSTVQTGDPPPAGSRHHA